MLDKFHFITVLVTLAVVITVVLTHYEGLHFFSDWMKRSKIRPRTRIVLMIYGLLALHTLEVWVFATGYWILGTDPGYGSLIGDAAQDTLLDYAYFSATVYSTLGFGDLVPDGPIRFIVGVESITGLLLITW